MNRCEQKWNHRAIGNIIVIRSKDIYQDWKPWWIKHSKNVVYSVQYPIRIEFFILYNCYREQRSRCIIGYARASYLILLFFLLGY